MPPIRLAELHPIIVHFPIALLIVSVCLDFSALTLRRSGLTVAATWCLVLGVPGAVAALASGWLSEHYVAVTGAAAVLLHLHKWSAVLTSVLFSALLAIRLVWLLPQILAYAGTVLPQHVKSLAAADRRLRMVLPVAYLPTPPRSVVAAYLFASVIGVGLLAITGYLGGALVYDHAVGMPPP